MAAILSLWENRAKLPIWIFSQNLRDVFKKDKLGREIAEIAIPAALALLADPVASLIDTAFIGHIGAVELAAVGVAIAVFNQVSRIAIFPVVSITTSFVAEEDTIEMLNNDASDNESLGNSYSDDTELQALLLRPESLGESSSDDRSLPEVTNLKLERRNIPSASSAMMIGAVLGLVQALFLICSAKPILKYMGIDSASPMFKPARQYLTLRSLGAPAVLLSLTMQGVFRGFKDTRTPLYAIVAGDIVNIILDPVFIFIFRMGVSGAAIVHVISQYLTFVILLWKLMQKVNLLPPHMEDLQVSRFLRNGFLLLLRVIAVTFCVTLGASLAARLGSIPMAAFQICLQIWLATSLLADGLAVAGQAILASAFARGDYEKASATASRVLQLGLALGIFLSVVLAAVMQFASRLFTKDANVRQFIALGIPFVAVTQPINALAFVFDGINYGASDFAYAAYSMVAVSVLSIVCLLLLSSSNGFVGIWVALSIYMTLRALAGFWRIGTGTGPWNFLRG